MSAKAPPFDNVGASWDRYRPKPELCPICKKRNCKVGAKTCRDPECAAEYDRRYNNRYYRNNADRIIANQKATRGSRATPPIVKYCEAPHPTRTGELCGEKFVTTGRGKGRKRTCSEACRIRLRNAQQCDRYHANPQAKQDYKNQHYADHYAHELVTKWCPYCGREFKTKKHNQQTCGRPYCIQRIYETTARKDINARKRKKRRENPGVDAAYQRKYGIANPEKIKGYRAKNRAKKLEKLDHIDRDKINRGLRTNNTSGYTGVSRMRTKWCAYIRINGKRKGLGCSFATKEAAAAAYRKAAEEARLKTAKA
jgi:hypothetical protein